MLFRSRRTNFTDNAVHERVCTAGVTIRRLHCPLNHHPFAGAADLIRKSNAYAALFAQQNAGRRKSSPLKAVNHALWTLFKSLILQRGVTEGEAGDEPRRRAEAPDRQLREDDLHEGPVAAPGQRKRGEREQRPGDRGAAAPRGVRVRSVSVGEAPGCTATYSSPFAGERP